jgi:hypothetical protein
MAELRPGAALGPMTLRISGAANERYWSAAGVDHPALRAGTLYPAIATNLTVLLFNEHCHEAVIQTRQRLACHRASPADVELTTTGVVTAVYEQRGRAYVDIAATVTVDGEPLWTSVVSFTPAATFGKS